MREMKTVTRQHFEYVHCLEETVSELVNVLCLGLGFVPDIKKRVLAHQAREQLLKLNGLCDFEFGDSNSSLLRMMGK